MFHFYLFDMACVAESKNWYFVVEVREGAPGWVDNDRYRSKNFDSFQDCYTEYVRFSPAKHWRRLRGVHNAYIGYQRGDVKILSKAIDGMIYYRTNHCVEDLGITEEEFDALIAKLT